MFTAIVDPFGTVRLVDVAGFNHYKPAMFTRIKLLKAMEVRRIQPEAIVLGTSRSHLALRMSHPGWQATPRYNLAFDGATTEEMYEFLRHAQTVYPLRQVVLGLDTWQLGTDPSTVRPDFDPSILYDPDSAWSRLGVPLSDLRMLLSFDTLEASWHTLREQAHAEASWFGPDGQRLGEIFFLTGEPAYVTSPGDYFRDVDRQEIGFKLAPEQLPAGPTDPPQSTWLTSFDYIRRIVAFCRSHAIDLRILITPAHAHQMEISLALGEETKIEAGKRALVMLLAEDAAAHHTAPFPFWDFSGYSKITMEPVPPPGSVQDMRYYWDSSHFKQIVGDFVLDRLFGVDAANSVPPADFGRMLDPKTIEPALAAIRAAGARYRENHPSDIAMLADMIAAAKRGETALGNRFAGSEEPTSTNSYSGPTQSVRR